jgi:radical SAM-linked protein
VTDLLTEPDTTSAISTSLRVRYRIRFAKTDLLRWIGHTDLIRLWERIARRSQLPLSMSQGFHRRPRMAFPSALALGIVGLDEVAEIELREELSAEELHQRLIADNQPGLTFSSVRKLDESESKAQLDRSDYVVDVPPGVDVALAQSGIDRLKHQNIVTFQRKEKLISTDIRAEIPRLEVDHEQLRFTLVARDAASIRPDDLLGLLGLSDWPLQGATITRTRVHLRSDHAHSTGDAGSKQDDSSTRPS